MNNHHLSGGLRHLTGVYKTVIIWNYIPPIREARIHEENAVFLFFLCLSKFCFRDILKKERKMGPSLCMLFLQFHSHLSVRRSAAGKSVIKIPR